MFRVFFGILLLLVIFSASAKKITGQVIKVSDGDTIVILTKQSKKIKIRLAEIDTPEMAQPYGKVARFALNKLIYAKTVKIVYKNKDQYQRIVGRVFLKDQDICAEMVAQGHAWVYRGYSEDVYLYLLEYWARFKHHGLWSLPAEKRQPPWEWRRQKNS